jgi:release factor glutamine methyltransferase
MEYQKVLKETEEKFRQADIETADLDTLILLSFVIKKPKEFILAHPEITLTKAQEKQFLTLAKKRSKRFPLAYIIGYKEFYGRKFVVNKDVLIPRPETEKIVELALNYINEKILNHHARIARCACESLRAGVQDDNSVSILDIGTGSGCIAITLALELEEYPAFATNYAEATLVKKSYAGLPAGKKLTYKIIASDISTKALAVAKLNAKKLKASSISFVKSDLFKNIKTKFDIIVTDLPYVEKEEIKNELNFEPQLALEDKNQIPQMLKDFKRYLNPNGILIYEITNGKVKMIK